MSRIDCTACAPLPRPSPHCHECKGLGYIERFPPCTVKVADCPIVGEAMTGGWECTKCGRSGPRCEDVL